MCDSKSVCLYICVSIYMITLIVFLTQYCTFMFIHSQIWVIKPPANRTSHLFEPNPEDRIPLHKPNIIRLLGPKFYLTGPKNVRAKAQKKAYVARFKYLV